MSASPETRSPDLHDSRTAMARVFSRRDFRLLVGGAGTSLLGDQFTLIATPWLVLSLTHDPFLLGLALALEGAPRALLMLFGGTVSDRLSPRTVMLAANVTRLILVTVMATLVLANLIQLWMVLLFGLLFGTVAGLAIPAENSVVPRLVSSEELQAGNSVMMGLTQLAGFVGPTVAGVLIGGFADSLRGVGFAFTIDAITFVVSAITLWLIRDQRSTQEPGSGESVLAATLSGVRYLWGDRQLRVVFLALLLVNLLLMGPLLVGIPILADTRLAEGAGAYGVLMSAFAIGNLLGFALAGFLPRPSGRQLHRIIVALFAGFGLVIGSLGLIASTWLDFALLTLLGLGNGFMAILLVTWMQSRTRKEMHGRMMGLMMLASTGVAPVSQAAAGLVSSHDLDLLFVGPGLLVLLVTAWVAFDPTFGALGTRLATESCGNQPAPRPGEERVLTEVGP